MANLNKVKFALENCLKFRCDLCPYADKNGAFGTCYEKMLHDTLDVIKERREGMKGVIIIGYQGIGKSSCAGTERCIDLESSNFFIGDRRAEDWFIPYCQTAMNLANQRYVVMTSSHKVVRDTFETMPKLKNVGAVVVFCPTRSMKEEWIQRLQERYDRTGLFKDYKALMNAKERYDENIAELVNSPFPVYQPAAIDYDLRNYIYKIEFDWCMEGR